MNDEKGDVGKLIIVYMSCESFDELESMLIIMGFCDNPSIKLGHGYLEVTFIECSFYNDPYVILSRLGVF